MPDVRLVSAANLPVSDPDTPRLADALAAAGLTVDVADWRAPDTPWHDTPLTILRSPWDYVDHIDEFLTWAGHVATVSALWNPLAVVQWNTHKAYLLDLAARGAPIVPTVVLTRGAAAALDGIADARGWNTLVVKPAVDVGARGAGRFDVGDARGQTHLDACLERGDVLVQPYVRSVETEGELSLVLVDGVASHAVRKRPAPGDYRIHEQYGGRHEPLEPTRGLVELAERVCALAPEPVLYGRVDVLLIDGRFHLVELEVTEPRLFLGLAPERATERLVDAVMARLE